MSARHGSNRLACPKARHEHTLFSGGGGSDASPEIHGAASDAPAAPRLLNPVLQREESPAGFDSANDVHNTKRHETETTSRPCFATLVRHLSRGRVYDRRRKRKRASKGNRFGRSPDLLRQEVQIGFERGDDPVLVVHMPAGSIAVLMLRLAWCSQQLSLQSPREIDLAQPTRLQGASPFVLNDGRKGLHLGIVGIQVPLVLTIQQIEDLRNILEQLTQAVPGHRLS